LVDQIIDDNANFIHLTFAEYFVAEYFVSKMKNIDNMDLKIQDLLLSNVLCKEKSYQTVRVFLDGFLKKLSEKGENLQLKVNDNNLLKMLIHLAVSEGNSHIFESLFSNLEVNDEKELVNHHFKRLLNLSTARESMMRKLVDKGADVNSKDNFHETPLHVALRWDYG
jgi:ankyrin repeat protein